MWSLALKSEGISEKCKFVVLRGMLSSYKRACTQVPRSWAATRSLVTAAYVWGEGTVGQLGLGPVKMNRKSFDNSKFHVGQVPRMIPASKNLNFTDLALGGKFSLGLTADGHLYGWGKFWGLGNEGKVEVLEPTALSLEPKFTGIGAGKSHGAAIDKDGQVYTFGRYKVEDKKGFFSWLDISAPEGGWLGHGDNAACDTPRLVESFRDYGARAKKVVCGDKHTLILTDDGEVLACGVGEQGRLGTSDVGIAWQPQTLETLLEETVVDLACGGDSSYALTEKNEVFVWGNNGRGQLGLSDTFVDINSVQPVPLKADLEELGGRAIKKVTACGQRAAILTEDGKVYIWGYGHASVPTELIMGSYYADHGQNPDGSDDPVVDLAIAGGQRRKHVLTLVLRSGLLVTMGDSATGLLARPGLMGRQALDRCDKFAPKPKDALPMVTRVFSGLGMHAACLVDRTRKV